MRILVVQIQSNRIGAGDRDRLVEALRSAADDAVLRFAGVNNGEDDGPYINVRFEAPDHIAAWAALRTMYMESDVGRELASSTIATCEGEHGWDDYLLLHHFDPRVQLDELGCKQADAASWAYNTAGK